MQSSTIKSSQPPSPLVFILIGVGALLLLLSTCYCGYRVYCSYTDMALDCSNIRFYALKGCGPCARAKEVLDSKGITYNFLEYSGSGPRIRMPNGEYPISYPTIWVGDKNMGGNDNLLTWVSQCAP